jgi:hypothetical protein
VAQLIERSCVAQRTRLVRFNPFDPADGEEVRVLFRDMLPFEGEIFPGRTLWAHAVDEELLRGHRFTRTLAKDGCTVQSYLVKTPGQAPCRIKLVPENHEDLIDALAAMGDPVEYAGQSAGKLALEIVHAAFAQNRVNPGAKRKAALLEDQGGLCAECGSSVRGGFVVDHVRPLRAGGGNQRENLQVLCACCHRSKTSLEAQCLTKLRVIESCVSEEVYVNFVKGPKPQQLVYGKGDQTRKWKIVDIISCRPASIYENVDLPVFSPLDEIVPYDGGPLEKYDFLYVSIPGPAGGKLVPPLPYDGPRFYTRIEALDLQEQKVLKPHHVTRTLTAKGRAETATLQRTMAEVKRHMGKTAELAAIGLMNNNEVYTLTRERSNCEGDVGQAYRKRFDPATGEWDFWSRTDHVTFNTCLPIGLLALGGEIVKALRILRVCERLGVPVDGVRNDGVRVPAADAERVAKEANAENCRRHGSEEGDTRFAFCRVKADEGVPPTNAWKRPVRDHPLKLLPPEWTYGHTVDDVIANGGGLVEGPPGVGKSHFIKEFASRVNCTTTAFQKATARRLGNNTLYHVLRRGVRTEWLVIDEVSQIPTATWSYLAALHYMGTKFLLVGDFAQLPPINDRFAHSSAENSKVVRGLANNMKLEMRENHRCRDHPEHFEYLLELRAKVDGPCVPDYARFPCRNLRALPDLFVCQTNASRLKANALANPHMGVFEKPERWTPPEPQDAWLHPGVPVIGVAGTKHSGLYSVVESATPDQVALVTEDGERFTLDKGAFLQTMRLAYAVTCHAVQGLTIRDKKVWMLDAHYPHTTARHFLVAASRVTDPKNFEVLTPEQQREFLRGVM